MIFQNFASMVLPAVLGGPIVSLIALALSFLFWLYSSVMRLLKRSVPDQEKTWLWVQRLANLATVVSGIALVAQIVLGHGGAN